MTDVSQQATLAEVKTQDAFSALAELESAVASAKNKLANDMKKAARDADLFSEYDKPALQEFLDKPYRLEKFRDGVWRLIVPRFIGFKGGWLERHDGAYSIFIVNRLSHLMSPLPSWVLAEAGITSPSFNAILEGATLTITEGDPDEAYKKLGGDRHIAKRKGREFELKPRSRVEIIRTLIREEGIMPFTPRPIPKNLLRPPLVSVGNDNLRSYSLRSYQRATLEKIMQLGSGLVVAYPQTGKSFVSLEMLAMIRGEKIIFCPKRSLVEQWKVRLDLYLTPQAAREVTISTYQSAKKYLHRKWALAIFDEAHRVPAKFAIETALSIMAEVRLGLSATPFREDNNHDLMPMLCGFPMGTEWEVKEIQKPDVFVWIVKSLEDKIKLAKKLATKTVNGKTLIFTQRIAIGDKLSRVIGVPFAHGSTTKPLNIIKANKTVVVSSIADEGLSAGVERIIEVDFLFGCYDDQTEVLTSKGFKKFSDVTLDDKIATLNNDGYLVYQTPLEKQAYRYDGNLIHFSGRGYDLMVTPNHRMFIRKEWQEGWQFKEAHEFIGLGKNGITHYELKKDARWKGGSPPECFSVPDEFTRKFSPVTKRHSLEIPIIPFLKFLGWYLSEGSVRGGGRIQIHQTKQPHVKEIESVIREMGFDPITKDARISFSHRPLGRYLKQFGTCERKFIPQWVKELSPDYLLIIIDSLMKGDGSRGIVYYTTSKKLADDIQEISIKCGYGTTLTVRRERTNRGSIRGREIKSVLPSYELNLAKKEMTPEIKKPVSEVEYHGDVFCVTVPNGVILTRRNGKAVWCGNSRMQAGQRAGRLGDVQEGQTKKGEHHILMTPYELKQYGKRLLAYEQWGLKVTVITSEAES